ncbi:S41 family peptidase [Polaribacter batillariae]|uniref:S41 family peptidase n=1 Tax=Polaribacter batillariae TaxID=2808900 RepID=A0ABX7SPN8_9FLAO|nr:S41 family peptidase [Polaribacter batillariae]QTD36204.1 S41 family peptidase [Polaribacter batillariae]
MKKFNFKKRTIIILLVGAVFMTYSFKSKFFEVAKQIEIYNTLFKELNMYYVDEINPAEFTDKAIKNTLKDLDPYTNFYNEQDVETARIRRAGEYGGIGVSVHYTKKGIEISEIYKDFSADKANLKVGDIITSVDGQSLKNMDKEQLATFLKGVPNSTIKVTIERQGQIFKKEITRDKVVVNPVPFAEMVNEDTGYITLTRFNEKASSEVKKAFRKLEKQGMKKLVFDLRSNPGGSLLESINICNFFLPKGKTIVTTKAKIKKWSNTYKTTNEPLDLEIPIVVLVNERSASASEIVSGALQDYDRAVIMGKRSFGKGLVQRYRPLTYGTQLKVTISKYYTPSGRCIQELDYANRDKNGKVPKFSDRGINAFKTENGRTVYDGGGVLPDVVIETSDRNKATEALLKSKAIFNFATKYYYENPTIGSATDFDFKNSDFNTFKNYLKIDTTFLTKQENLFKKAYLASNKNRISKEYKNIKEKLFDVKIEEISKNEDILTNLIKEEILHRYFYREGVYEHQLKKDKTISKAVDLLNNQTKYSKILSSN